MIQKGVCVGKGHVQTTIPQLQLALGQCSKRLDEHRISLRDPSVLVVVSCWHHICLFSFSHRIFSIIWRDLVPRHTSGSQGPRWFWIIPPWRCHPVRSYLDVGSLSWLVRANQQLVKVLPTFGGFVSARQLLGNQKSRALQGLHGF